MDRMAMKYQHISRREIRAQPVQSSILPVDPRLLASFEDVGFEVFLLDVLEDTHFVRSGCHRKRCRAVIYSHQGYPEGAQGGNARNVKPILVRGRYAHGVVG